MLASAGGIVLVLRGDKTGCRRRLRRCLSRTIRPLASRCDVPSQEDTRQKEGCQKGDCQKGDWQKHTEREDPASRQKGTARKIRKQMKRTSGEVSGTGHVAHS